MLYRLLRSDPKTHSGNPSELVICIEPEPLQSKMELLPTNFLLDIQHFLSPAPLSRFVLQHERNDSYLQFPFYRKFLCRSRYQFHVCSFVELNCVTQS